MLTSLFRIIRLANPHEGAAAKTPEARLIKSLKHLGSNTGTVYWNRPHNLAINIVEGRASLWKFSILMRNWDKYAYVPARDGVVVYLQFHPTDGSILGTPIPGGFFKIEEDSVDRALSAINSAPTIEETVNQELDMIERKFSITISPKIRARIVWESNMASRHWDVDPVKKHLIFPLDGGKMRGYP